MPWVWDENDEKVWQNPPRPKPPTPAIRKVQALLRLMPPGRERSKRIKALLDKDTSRVRNRLAQQRYRERKKAMREGKTPLPLLRGGKKEGIERLRRVGETNAELLARYESYARDANAPKQPRGQKASKIPLKAREYQADEVEQDFGGSDEDES